MRLLWQARSSPLAWWWALLTLVSSGNIAFWFLLYCQFHMEPTGSLDSASDLELMLFLCAAYVFGCAFRLVLPRADVQRICLFDTWLSSVVIGRSVATVAEVCFAGQWAMVLHQLGGIAGVAIIGIAAYLAFVIAIDVPVYLSRWRDGLADGSKALGPLAGLRDASTRWVVTHDFARWKDEIAWMSLYFTAAVWASLALCLVYFLGDALPW